LCATRTGPIVIEGLFSIRSFDGADRLGDIWAKSPRAGQARGETLLAHTNAVLTTVRRLQAINPNLPERTGEPAIWHWIYWACALHDFGKAAQGFQRQLREPFRWERRHEVLSLAFVPLLGIPVRDPAYRAIVAGIVAHHRDADRIEGLYPVYDPITDERVEAMVAEIPIADVEALATWVGQLRGSGPALGEGSRQSPAEFAASFAGSAVSAVTEALEKYQLLVFALHSGRERPALLASLALRGLVMSADHIASAHQWEKLRAGVPPTAANNFRPEKPWSHQSTAEGHSGSMMLVAPTGSGKTETAVLWAAKQQTERPVSHLFYVLPYQASMNAMKRRLEPGLGEVSLIHGRALEAVYRQVLELDNSKINSIRKAHAAQNLASLQVHGTRILSPYQLLKVAFRLKGYEAVAADLFDSALVYDEIHAYEPKRLALIIGQLGDLVNRFGARACLMSATLPSFLRGWLAEVVPELVKPVISTPQEFASFRRHELHLLAGDLLDDLNAIERKARETSVLICCNTVRRAQAAFDGLRARGLDAVLLHGRFNGRDRLLKEGRLRPGEEQQLVMVATQVVEVSLNVSFGTIFSDPAPLEALFQRFGRVNRFRALGQLAPVNVYTGELANTIYSAALVAEAVRVLREHEGQAVDEAQLTGWLDDQYTPAILANLDAEYRPTLALMQDKLKRLAPFQSDDSLRDEFFDMFDSIEVLPTNSEADYRALATDGQLIEADSLLVPISIQQWGRLRGNGLTRVNAEGLRIVNVPYDAEYGLRLP